jgi:hypothetical protein
VASLARISPNSAPVSSFRSRAMMASSFGSSALVSPRFSRSFGSTTISFSLLARSASSSMRSAWYCGFCGWRDSR